jgi:hypothetical protein
MEEERAVKFEAEVQEEGAVDESVVQEVTPSPHSEQDTAAAGETASPSTPKKDRGTSSIKDALKQAETFAQTLSEALQGRGNVVMVRVNDEALAHLDMLVEAEITKSRSESAAFLINEGINANEALFDRISAITDQIAELREKLRQEVKLPAQSGEADDKGQAE